MDEHKTVEPETLPFQVTVERAGDGKLLIGVHLSIAPDAIDDLPERWRRSIEAARVQW
jgi:hypothetical protein